MFDTSQIRKSTPPCPLCAGDTVLKQVHRELSRRLEVFKCLACAVEYPVVAALTESER
jgi:hypothetical protein